MKRNTYTAIIDYKMSNLYSVKHACDALGIRAVITSDPSALMGASAAILPGVGAFGDAMANLRKFGLIKPIHAFIASQRKFMGVCLGMQLLFDTSSEFGQHKGLGVFAGESVKFSGVTVPQIGWNTIYAPKGKSFAKTPLSSVRNNEYVYFVHSYYVKPTDKRIIRSLTTYEGVEYCSAVQKRNVFAVQFHPEKSGPSGIKLYKYLL